MLTLGGAVGTPFWFFTHHGRPISVAIGGGQRNLEVLEVSVRQSQLISANNALTSSPSRTTSVRLEGCGR
jgi:hypothetical protein